MDFFDWLNINAGWLSVICLSVVVSAALGYFTCAVDEQRRQALAWARGYVSGQDDLSRATELQEEIESSPNPYLP